jgi:SAM-dependent methyltransferase
MALPVALVCPRDRSPLLERDGRLECAESHSYALAEGTPVLLVEEERPTHGSCWVSLEPDATEPVEAVENGIDPVVQELLGATCGSLYAPLIGHLRSYPIPELRLPPGEGRLFLEVGSNWGRWCVAADRLGYRAVGVDPSLKGVRAAQRVAAQLDVDASYLVADARHLPFEDGSFDLVFSYSVFQHFAKADALAAFSEIGRVLRSDGRAVIQMANVWGLRSLWNQARERRFREPRTLFDVRYWGPRELERELSTRVGPTRLVVDGFFTLNPQVSDLELLPRRSRAVVHVSETLRRASGRLAPLRYAADSLYAISRPGGPA